MSAIFPGAATLQRARPAEGVKRKNVFRARDLRLTPAARSEGAVCSSNWRLQQIEKFIYGETCLLDDVAQRAAREVMGCVDWHVRHAVPVIPMHEEVMAALNTRDNKAAFFKGADDVSAVECR